MSKTIKLSPAMIFTMRALHNGPARLDHYKTATKRTINALIKRGLLVASGSGPSCEYGLTRAGQDALKRALNA